MHKTLVDRVLTGFALLLVFYGCHQRGGMAAKDGHLYSITINGHGLWVEIADTTDRQRVGLMFRDYLAPDNGMLFIYNQPQALSLWMKNTKLPLSAAFLDSSGRILNIAHRMLPYDDQTSHRSAAPAQYALEVNEGWFQAHNVKPGDVVDLRNIPRSDE